MQETHSKIPQLVALIDDLNRLLEKDDLDGTRARQLIDAASGLRSEICDQARSFEQLASKLHEVSRRLAETRRDLGRVNAEAVANQFIPEANDELEAVVLATEHATNRILEAAERIDENASGHPNSDVISDAVVEIFEACSFQDLTGQRIKKVFKTLEHTEAVIHQVLSMVGSEPDDKAAPSASPDEEDKLLNGPALPGQGVQQDDIDALFD